MVMIFGDVAVHSEAQAQARRWFGTVDWPLLWVEGASCQGMAIAGLQAYVLERGVELSRITFDGRVVGTIFNDEGARHCLLAGLGPVDVAAPGGEQTEQLLERVGSVLHAAGFSYGDVARTWFYNDDILTWYDEFNRARTAFYAQQRFASGSLPASTAVRGRNPQGAALAFACWAVLPVAGRSAVREVVSPLQCPAPSYGSSFSRATEISSPGRNRLLVSGTASIEPGGKTVWLGDVARQIELTMAVIEAILGGRGMSLRDITRATAYFKHAADVSVFENWCALRGLDRLPVLPVHCDICRDDLLFELEVDACTSR
jgi:enamine deaminase RidA (YjgF/YER057c/UK114 family)